MIINFKKFINIVFNKCIIHSKNFIAYSIDSTYLTNVLSGEQKFSKINVYGK